MLKKSTRVIDINELEGKRYEVLNVQHGCSFTSCDSAHIRLNMEGERSRRTALMMNHDDSEDSFVLNMYSLKTYNFFGKFI